MKKLTLMYFIFAFLLFVGGFLCGEYVANIFHQLDGPLKKFDFNLQYTQGIKYLLDVIIKDIKKNPQETVLKLEKLHNEINISYEGLPLDKLLLDAGFNPEDTYPPGN